MVTTLTAAAATVQAIRALRERSTDVVSLLEIHGPDAVPGSVPSVAGAEGAAERGEA